jgi:hypothetical protein
MVEAFRRDKSKDQAKELRLRGLDPKATYKVSDLDGGPATTISGSDLMQNGLPATIPDAPGAVIIIYEKI